MSRFVYLVTNYFILLVSRHLLCGELYHQLLCYTLVDSFLHEDLLNENEPGLGKSLIASVEFIKTLIYMLLPENQ